MQNARGKMQDADGMGIKRVEKGDSSESASDTGH